MPKPADFGRLADAMLNQWGTSVRRPGIRPPIESSEFDSVPTLAARRRPPALPPAARWARTPAAAAPPPQLEQSGAVLLPAFMVLRGAAPAPRGLASSVPFLAMIALVVILFAIVGLVVVVPNVDWALS